MALDLDRTQRKFYLVDTLVDTLLLEEDSQLEMKDRFRQITDVIFDLENQIEARHRSLAAEKDSEILKLRRILKPKVASESFILELVIMDH
jgi:transposase